jgi:tetratricopeptide (TPR) repeat protein
VFEPESKLRHLPFFEEIASRDEGSDDWHAASAGLVVLRLVDTWLEEQTQLVADDEWGVRSVRCSIEAVSERSPIRAILDRVVDALEERKPDIHVVVSPLLAYGRALEYDAKWFLATDVYHSILAHLHPIEDSDASIAAHMRLGYCYRSLHLIDEATEAFTAASEIATEAGDMVNVVLARVNEGHIAALRGNLPQAEAILDDAIMRSFAPEFRDVRSRALHERSNVAHRRKDYEFAVQLAYSAFREAQNPIERDRILNDLAGGFWELGVFSAARDAYLVLSATAQEQFMRWAATISLMDVSTVLGGQVLFELYRRQLVDVTLPPLLATAFELTSGLAYRLFGDLERARPFLKRAMAMAEEHRLNQYLFEAEEALRELEAAPPPRVPGEASLDLQEVAAAIRELRESVGAP